jgi:hypothetical protein
VLIYRRQCIFCAICCCSCSALNIDLCVPIICRLSLPSYVCGTFPLCFFFLFCVVMVLLFHIYVLCLMCGLSILSSTNPSACKWLTQTQTYITQYLKDCRQQHQIAQNMHSLLGINTDVTETPTKNKHDGHHQYASCNKNNTSKTSTHTQSKKHQQTVSNIRQEEIGSTQNILDIQI